jgi:transketolase
MADARLAAIARACRVQIIRMLTHAGSGHPGGSLSVIDLLVAIMFGRLRHDPSRPDWPERDRIVLSKGHAVPALYCAMAAAGYFSQDALITLRKLGSPLQGHPDRVALPGIEAATGSLGQGLSVALGLALGANASSIKPLDEEMLGRSAAKTGRVVTVEDHSIAGGLGGAVAEWLAELRPTPLKRIGTTGFGESGDPRGLYAKFGFDPAGIARTVAKFMGR